MLKRTSIIILFFIMFLTFVTPVNAKADELPSNCTRLSGNDRYETSAAISKYGWSQSNYAVLARGDDFPDALCASPLAKKYNAPILLTDPQVLSKTIMDELERLHVSSMFIIGGTGAVSEDIENEIKSKGISVTRVWGQDRYGTSVEIAKMVGVNGNVALTTGENFPDALSVSVPAAIKGIPILLSEKNTVPEKVMQFINSNLINKTYLIGGKGVLSDSLFEYVPCAERVCGNDRYETNVAVMQKFSSDLNFGEVFLAVADGPYGDEFADALSGSAYAAKGASPVVLVNKSLPAPADYFLRPLISDKTKVTLLGGEAVVPSKIADNLIKGTGGTAAFVSIADPPSTIKAWESKKAAISTVPSDAEISVGSSNPGVAAASVSGKYVTVTGISPGMSVITVNVKKQGYAPGYASFLVISPVYNATKDCFYNTIQGALNNASANDMILAASGVYYEHLRVKTNNIKLIGEDRDKTIIDASQTGGITRAGIKIEGYSGALIKNFTVRNAGVNVSSDSFREPFGLYISNGSENIIKNVSFKSNGTYEVYLSDGSSNNTIKDCIIDGAGVERDGYRSLDGIFSCGRESGSYSRGVANTGNKFQKNIICNVVNGIALTASNSNWIMENEIYPVDSTYWKGYDSTGVVISNGSMNIVQENTMDSPQYGIRLSELSSISPYAYAGQPNSNLIRDNVIKATKNGIKLVGTGNMMRGNTISGSSDNGVWISGTAKGNSIEDNNIKNNNIGLLVENESNDIHLNRITDNTKALKNTKSAILIADRNWWGTSSDPSNLIIGNVSCSPWAVDSTCTKFNK